MSGTPATFPDLRGQLIAVTGGASGIGAAIVQAFHRQGSRVVFFDIDKAPGTALQSRLGERAHFIAMDLTDIDTLQTALPAIIKDHGNFDVLVNNAANDDRHRMQDVTKDYWRQRLAVNLDHVYFMSQAVIPGMISNQKGAIINMSSIAWRFGLSDAPAYVAAKAAIEALTHAMAREFGPAGIRVNAIAPGAVSTRRQLDNWLPPEMVQTVLDNQCLKRLIEPEGIAEMVLVLASETSRAMTNQVVTVDAGWT
ncbi:MAG: SDR family NAD(P)-dependent oxidoreductase [Granulosicoccus sp.]